MENNQIHINLFYHLLFFINHELSINQSNFTRYDFLSSFLHSEDILHYVLKFHEYQ